MSSVVFGPDRRHIAFRGPTTEHTSEPVAADRPAWIICYKFAIMIVGPVERKDCAERSGSQYRVTPNQL